MIKKYAILERHRMAQNDGHGWGTAVDYRCTPKGQPRLFDTEEHAVAYLVRNDIGGHGIIPYYVKE